MKDFVFINASRKDYLNERCILDYSHVKFTFIFIHAPIIVTFHYY